MSISTRREFLKISALSACSLLISTGLSGCMDDDKEISVSFLHGVASGDPLSDRVIIWTRVTTDASSIDINYEVATDAEFSNIIHDGFYTTDSSKDYTVKIDVQNLSEATKYYYRFSSNGTTSQSGVMKTLATGTQESLKMAVFSCANYTNGYFNPYMEASKLSDLDVTLHLGDYIYEYGKYENDDFDAQIPSYATSDSERIGRTFPDDNNKECFTLNDYRKRYALYRKDKGLQALHGAAPMIAVWDDHEIANDTYKDGAENHQIDEGDFQTRVESALQAYFEWMPIRPITNKKEIYRTFNFGDLVSLNMLETRIFGRDEQLSYGDFYTQNGDFLATEFTNELTNPNRTMLGTSQLQWLQGEMAASNATWQVLGQQVLMGRMNLPAEVLTKISQLDNPEMFGTTTEALLLEINTSLAELATLKARYLQGDTTLSETDLARINTTLPYNLDAWDGYYIEREAILATAKAYSKNLVVLAGDTHNAWANNLKDNSGDTIGVEFATAAVSSPGLEEYLSLETLESAAQVESVLSLLVDDLKYTNLYDRGFMEVVYTKNEVKSHWHYVDSNESEVYNKNILRSRTLECKVSQKILSEENL